MYNIYICTLFDSVAAHDHMHGMDYIKLSSTIIIMFQYTYSYSYIAGTIKPVAI